MNSGQSNPEYGMLLYFALAVAATIGAYIRIGISNYRIWNVETNYTVMYTQIIGCVIMGFAVGHKRRFFENGSKIEKIIYIAVTSGLCGSITTFSSWSMECNKSFFLQWDSSPSNYFAVYNGGRLFEWFECLAAGSALPLLGLRFGNYLTNFSRWRDKAYATVANDIQPTDDQLQMKLKYYLVGSFFLILVLVIVLPIVVGEELPSSMYFTYTAVFGALGAVLRYHLSQYNAKSNSEIPLGTFIANVSGTWFLAVLTVLAKFVASYYNDQVLAVLYGLSTGFCGCLTTVSTYAVELDRLDADVSYRYGISSNLVAQFGIVLIYNVYASQLASGGLSGARAAPVPSPAVRSVDIKLELCQQYLVLSNCSLAEQTVTWSELILDLYPNHLQLYCTCGAWDISDTINNIAVNLIASPVSSDDMTFVWPISKAIRDPTQVIDFDLTFKKVCQHYLARIECPLHAQKIGSHSNDCHCQQTQDTCDVSNQLVSMITGASLLRRYDMQAHKANLQQLADGVDYCAAFRDVCGAMLDHVQCPVESRQVVGCGDDSVNAWNGSDDTDNYLTFAGRCNCLIGPIVDLAPGVSATLFNTILSPWTLPVMSNGLIQTGIVSVTSGQTSFNYTNNFKSMCTVFQFILHCPSSSSGSTTMTDKGDLICSCHQLSSSLTNFIGHSIIYTSLSEYITRSNLGYIAPVQSNYELIVSSNPFKKF